MKMKLVVLGLVLAMSAFAPAAANADTFVLDVAHFNTGLTGPYGTVELTQGVDAVDVTVTLIPELQFIDVNGFTAGSFAFNLTTNANLVSFTNVSSGFVAGSDGTLDGFGTFGYSVACLLCGGGSSNPNPGPLSFTVLRTGLTISDFLVLSTNPPGDAQSYFAADVYASGGSGLTGAIGGGGTPVPEPASMLLLGTGLLGLGVVARRRRK